MTDFTRVSVRGATRRAEIAVSSDDPLGTMLPQLIDALAEPVGAVPRPLTLLTTAGEPLDLDRSAREQGIADGTALRLLPFDAAPPPPLVIDVVDVVADELGERHDRWDDRARRAVTGVLVALTAAAGCAALPLVPEQALAARLGILGILLAAAIGFGLAGGRRIAPLFAAGAAGAVVPVALQGASLADAATEAALLLPALALGASSVVLLGVGVAQRSRGALTGGALGIALTAALLLMLVLGMSPGRAAAVMGVVAVLLVGVVPWIALSASGLTGLDHRAADQGDLPRPVALIAVDDAYRTLGWCVGTLAVVAAICGVMLWAEGTVWGALLSVVIAVVLVLRSRVFPLRSHGLLLWGGAVAIGGFAVTSTITRSELGWVIVGGALLGGVLIAISGTARPRAHQRARLRSLGDLAETVLVVAVLPLLVGVFGFYADMLALFGDGA